MNYSRKNWKNTLYINAIPLFLIAIIFFISEKTDRQQNTDDLIQIKSIHSKIYSFPKEEKKYTEGNLIFNKFFKYTINGLLNQTFQYKTNTLFSYTNYYYDTNNLLMQSKEYNSDNTLYLIINYTHDKKGFVTRADYIRTDQKLFNGHRNPVNVEFEKF
ncbi:MAG TPA: hypothetical protein EYP69_05250, partial [Bacteroidales bacterium]|nr:hypothetical protein [Bacteroidales bacterium]